MAIAKKQEVKPWGLKFGAAFLIFVLSSLAVSSDSPKSSIDTSVATSPVQQKTTEELEREKQEKERQAALDQRKKEQEEKRREEQQKQKAWEQQEQEKNKYSPISTRQMLDELESNSYVAKQKYESKYFKISRAQIKYISDDGKRFLADGGNDLEWHALLVRVSKDTKGLSVANLRKGQYVTVYGKVAKIDVVGTDGLKRDVIGYEIQADKIDNR